MECRTVERLLDAATSGTPSLLLVGGDAGIGKTALVEDAAARASGRGFRTLSGSCLDISANVPFSVVLEALAPVLDGASDQETGPATARLAALVRARGTSGTLAPGELFDLLRRCVGEVARRPLLLVLEDLHWAQQSSRDFALALSRSLTGPVVVVLTYRAEDLHRRHPFRSCLVDLGRYLHAHHLDLEPLDRDALGALVASAGPGPRPTRRTSARCWPARRATRCSPRRSWPSTTAPRHSRRGSPTCCCTGSTGCPRTPVTCCARPRSPGRGSTSGCWPR